MHHLCASDDYAYAISKIQKKHPKASIVGLGTSMGAGILLKYATETGENCTLKAIAAVATPFDYIICREHLNSWWPYLGLSDLFILSALEDQLESISTDLLLNYNDELLEKKIVLKEVVKARSSLEFDQKFTIKLYGYENTDEYYKQASVASSLNKIQIPVLALSSKDDPVVTASCIPYEQFYHNPNLVLAITNVGGHVGWFTGLSPKRWYPKPCLEFLDSILDNN